ncbi:MAG: hypothetical protein IK105_04780 [Thermoguttaceae bacterium]|nr:hypothetical protein [Thermoguttaceae bacterium]MBR5415230.1 hypothetical protein [Thermoguttaceae bacterium]MCR5359552.1 hypothetical protein [Thermoguttaceae bacterium]
MKKVFGGILFLLGLWAISGCDRPEVPQSEYGQIIDELPEFPGSPKTLPVPDGLQEDLRNTGSF